MDRLHSDAIPSESSATLTLPDYGRVARHSLRMTFTNAHLSGPFILKCQTQ